MVKENRFKQKSYKLTKLNKNMTKYNILIEQDEEGWYISEVIELPGCHSQAKTIDELIKRTKEAIKGYLETNNKKLKLPCESFIGMQQLEV